jgi:hypothetical protein
MKVKALSILIALCISGRAGGGGGGNYGWVGQGIGNYQTQQSQANRPYVPQPVTIPSSPFGELGSQTNPIYVAPATTPGFQGGFR